MRLTYAITMVALGIAGLLATSCGMAFMPTVALFGFVGLAFGAAAFWASGMISTDAFGDGVTALGLGEERRGAFASIPIVPILFVVGGMACTWLLVAFWGRGQDITYTWSEDVRLRDGRTISVERSVTKHSQPWQKDRGTGGIAEQRIELSLDGRAIEWRMNQQRGLNKEVMPDIVDVLDGAPVIVFPVDRVEPCKAFDYPPQGIVAFHYLAGRWSRVPATDLPADLRVNLLRSTHEVQYNKKYSKHVSIEGKDSIDQLNRSGILQGTSLSELIGEYSNGEYACAFMRQEESPQLRGAREAISNAERNATATDAIIVDVSEAGESFKRSEVQKIRGEATRDGYLSSTCQGVVRSLEAYRKWNPGSGDAPKIGHQLLLNNSVGPVDRIQIADARPGQVDRVLCTQRVIFVVLRTSPKEIKILRFARDGQIIDVTEVHLQASMSLESLNTIWEVTASDDSNLDVSLAAYSVPSLETTLVKRKVTFRAPLPSLVEPTEQLSSSAKQVNASNSAEGTK